MSRHRVVVSGRGVVSALGHDVESFWDNCLDGKEVVEPIPENWSRYYNATSEMWSPLPDPDYKKYGLRKSDLLTHDRAVLNAIVASDDAIEEACFELKNVDNKKQRFHLNGVDEARFGVFIGTGLGCITSSFNNYVPHLLRTSSQEIFQPKSRNNSDAIDELCLNFENNRRSSPFSSCQSMANAIAAVLSIRYQAKVQQKL